MREELSRPDRLRNLDLLVLPELAFTGYNFPSLDAIAPYLEPTAQGPSTRWASRTARRLGCSVAVGYPEASLEDEEGQRNGRDMGDEFGGVSKLSTDANHGDSNGNGHDEDYDDHAQVGNFNTIYDSTITSTPASSSSRRKLVAYNSLVIVDHTGAVIAHHRKSHLYYTDETWAREGKQGFYARILPLGGGDRVKHVKLAAGICMDINPYKFEAAWEEYEFARFVADKRVRVVVVSMAWLTRLSQEEVTGVPGVDDRELRMRPDMDTVSYWVERFQPLWGDVGEATDGSVGASKGAEEVIIICANRTGEEGISPRIGEVRYAGSSCVMGLTRAHNGKEGKVRIWNMLGRAESGLLIVDTDQPANYTLQQKEKGSASDPQRRYYSALNAESSFICGG